MLRGKIKGVVLGSILGIVGVVSLIGNIEFATTKQIESQVKLNNQKEYQLSETTSTETDQNGITWGYSVNEDGNAINVRYINGNLNEIVTIPSELNGHAVVELYNTVDSNSIFNSNASNKNEVIKQIILPDTLKNIGDNAFKECIGLTSINIPNNVNTIGSFAFYNCKSISNMKIPNQVTSIGNYAFKGCSNLLDIKLSKNITEIGLSTFTGCSKLNNVNIPKNVTNIGIYAFSFCEELTNINIPKEVENINSSAFAYCDNVTICTNGDNIAKYAEEKNINYKYDKILPELKIEGNLTSWTNENVILNIVANDYISGLNNVTINEVEFDNQIKQYEIKENGSYTIVAMDNVGNEKIEKIQVKNIDKTVPEIKSITKSTENKKEKINLTVNAVDNESGIAGYSWDEGRTWQSANQYEVKSNGTYKVFVRDKAGNVSEKSIEITNIGEEEPFVLFEGYEVKAIEGINYIVGISGQLNIAEFRKSIKTNLNYTVVDRDEHEVGEEIFVATGMKIKVSDGNEYILTVNADLNSDGKTDISDLGIMASYVVGKGNLKMSCMLAGDINKDNKLDITDVSILAIAITRNIKL